VRERREVIDALLKDARAMHEPEALKRLGRVIGARYRLKQVVRVGAFASLYEGLDEHSGRAVAVKMMHSLVAEDAAMRLRFEREAAFGRRIQHRGVVPIEVSGVHEDSCLYLVMPYLTGETVDERSRRTEGNLLVSEGVAIAVSLLDVLGVVHEAGLVHCDVKPANVHLSDKGEVRLLDFGIARSLEQGREAGLTHLDRGSTGTPLFMAPEQMLDDAPIDAQADVWAVGALMLWCFSGSRAIEALSLPGIRRWMNGAIQVPNEVRTVVDRALELEPNDRWDGAWAMELALKEAYLEAYGLEVPAPPAGEPSQHNGATGVGGYGEHERTNAGSVPDGARHRTVSIRAPSNAAAQADDDGIAAAKTAAKTGGDFDRDAEGEDELSVSGSSVSEELSRATEPARAPLRRGHRERPKRAEFVTRALWGAAILVVMVAMGLKLGRGDERRPNGALDNLALRAIAPRAIQREARFADESQDSRRKANSASSSIALGGDAVAHRTNAGAAVHSKGMESVQRFRPIHLLIDKELSFGPSENVDRVVAREEDFIRCYKKSGLDPRPVGVRFMSTRGQLDVFVSPESAKTMLSCVKELLPMLQIKRSLGDPLFVVSTEVGRGKAIR
jgi:serine/threonine-protein kinase